MQLIASILLLVVITIALGLWYFGAIIVIVAFIKTLKALFTTLPGKLYKKRIKEKIAFNPLHLFSRQKWIRIIILFSVLNVALYVYARDWLMHENAQHTKAKEYFSTGEVLSSHLGFLTFILHPDSLTLKPLFALQHGIYNLGIVHLPKEDAEDALWYHRWFIYPYAKQDALPKVNRYLWILFPKNDHSSLIVRFLMEDLSIKDIAPENYRVPQQRFLEKTFSVIEKLSTHPIRDPNMQREFMEGFPGLAFYYSLNQIYRYNGPAPAGRDNLRYEPWYTPHNEAQLRWYLSFERQMNAPQIQELYGKQLAKNQSLLYGAILNVTEDLILTNIDRMRFKCDSDYMQTYVRVRNLVAGEDGKENGIFYKLPKEEFNEMYYAYFEMIRPSFYKYISRDRCGYDVYGKAVLFTSRSEKMEIDSAIESEKSYLNKLNQQLQTGDK
ncbi:MAG: hypothetical protein PHQ90_03800 [Sulfuricurvum sp.]|uniref:hypothetical protein n=1 Tax=Sulfuricurvum sp. TaxID=2025608 RepID=UPI00261A5556|nr:hypothetical protein [Sulfuricurvum sp.]MDD2368401.1 hypothetical protein [Sulfuricurvum sp.]MDD2949358.1 hypothetical protein [Sulfuricurvum sp.]MDD5119680.1 hypothetical protein [Sulfuricurvum sp.]